MKRRVICALLMTALLSEGCSKTASDPERGIPPGMHLLADAQMYVGQRDSEKVRVVFLAHVINGGTETCVEHQWRVDWWPEELRSRLKNEATWGWGGPDTVALRPGDRYRPYGETLFDISGLSGPELDRLLTGLKFTVRCFAPTEYKNEVIFTVHKNEEPPPFAPQK